MQQVHGVAEQDLGLQLTAAVGGEHVVQVEGERRIGEALPRRAARRQALVAPSVVGRYLMQEQVESGGLWLSSSIVSGATAVTLTVLPIGGAGSIEAVVEQVAQDRGDGADGERRAHRGPVSALAR